LWGEVFNNYQLKTPKLGEEKISEFFVREKFLQTKPIQTSDRK